MARSTYYYHIKHMDDDKYAVEKEMIKDIFHENKGRYGYRRITVSLRNEGIILNHKTVSKLMKEVGVKCMVRIKKYKSYKGQAGKIAPYVLKRDFYANRPNQKWVTDVTEFAYSGEKLYLSPIMDLYNGEIISYTLKRSPKLDLVLDMIDSAFKKKLNTSKLTIHSDQGWHYQHNIYQKKLKQNGVEQSMSRKGNCLDNAVIENFFGLLKSELLYLQDFDSIEHLEREIRDYIDYYNHTRIKLKLNGMSPVQYRTHSLCG
jgi:transposase InsO family protein